MAAFYASSIFFSLAVAMPGAAPWIGPMPTPMGMMATAGMSPRPTPAPDSNGIPQELRRRQDVQYPPPDNWCGFVDGDYDTPLSCSAFLTCAHSGAALGCCTATTGLCAALYTTCLDLGEPCNGACERDPAILSCDALFPFCETYAFPGATHLYNCRSTTALPYSVEFLNDYYVSAIGSTLATDTSDLFRYKVTVTATKEAAPSSTGSISDNGDNGDDGDNGGGSSGGLSAAAIDGIAAAGAIVGVAILALIAFFCVRQRRKKRMAAAAFPNNPSPQQQPPPMQQQSPPPKAFDGYQAVAQQEQIPPKYSSPPPQPQQQQQQTGYFPPPGAPSTQGISPQPTGTTDPRFSYAPSLLSPQSPVSAPSISDQGGQRQSYYKPPLSPTVTEVDGTMGNPGIPPGAHGRANEVDGTMGNPGVPTRGHGIGQQMQAGGSPSATEIDGNMRASMHRPFPTDGGVYEMGQGGR